MKPKRLRFIQMVNNNNTKDVISNEVVDQNVKAGKNNKGNK